MSTLYLDQQGAALGCRAGRLVLTENRVQLHEVPVEQVDRILVYGQVQISTAALNALLRRGVPVTLLNSHGWLHGHLQPEAGGQVRRRARQYRVMGDMALGLPLARVVVAAKLRNQAHQLRRWGQGALAWQVRRLLVQVPGAADQDSLRGLEGSAARLCFSAFPALLSGSGFSFAGRRRRPAPDPVNALLSLGYTLLLGELRAALHGYGLDAFAGFFHASDGGQPACALDLIEPLRCLVDRLVLRLLRTAALSPEDFQVQGDDCRLKDGCRGRFYRAWEQMLADEVLWLGQHCNYRRLIHAQVGAYARHLDDPELPFSPFLLSRVGK